MFMLERKSYCRLQFWCFDDHIILSFLILSRQGVKMKFINSIVSSSFVFFWTYRWKTVRCVKYDFVKLLTFHNHTLHDVAFTVSLKLWLHPIAQCDKICKFNIFVQSSNLGLMLKVWLMSQAKWQNSLGIVLIQNWCCICYQWIKSHKLGYLGTLMP